MTKSYCFFALVFMLFYAGVAGAQDNPIIDEAADKVIQTYQNAFCVELWQEKGEPKNPMQENALELLRSDPVMRRAFINKVAVPIANKLFECGMIP